MSDVKPDLGTFGSFGLGVTPQQAREIEALGYGAVWVGEVGVEPRPRQGLGDEGCDVVGPDRRRTREREGARRDVGEFAYVGRFGPDDSQATFHCARRSPVILSSRTTLETRSR